MLFKISDYFQRFRMITTAFSIAIIVWIYSCENVCADHYVIGNGEIISKLDWM